MQDVADSRALGGVSVTWNLLKMAILEGFFRTEMREEKFEMFINIKQGSMRVKEYSLKFVKVSKYATTLVSNITD